MSVILHVEDDFGHALLVKRALEGLPFACDIKNVTDGQAAISYLHRLESYADPASSPRPALVLLDLNLPKVKGLEVLKQIKGDQELCDIPVVILTTSESAEDIRAAHENFAKKYLTKPANYLKLVEVLHELMAELQQEKLN